MAEHSKSNLVNPTEVHDHSLAAPFNFIASCQTAFLGCPDGLDGEGEPGGEEPVARALHGEEVDSGRGGHPQVRDERDEVVRYRDGLSPIQMRRGSLGLLDRECVSKFCGEVGCPLVCICLYL